MVYFESKSSIVSLRFPVKAGELAENSVLARRFRPLILPSVASTIVAH